MKHIRTFSAQDINDNDLFTGREVKRLLAEVTRDSSPYVKIAAAAEISGIPRSTLKSAAPRNYALQQRGDTPPIRVRRTSEAKGAHWLFHEGDCFASRRDSSMDGAELPAAEGEQDETVRRYVAKIAAGNDAAPRRTRSGKRAAK